MAKIYSKDFLHNGLLISAAIALMVFLVTGCGPGIGAKKPDHDLTKKRVDEENRKAALRQAMLRRAVLEEADAEESRGEKAEIDGKKRDALVHYIKALQMRCEAKAEDKALREKIIKIYHELDPPPAISEKAKRHAVRAQAFLETAGDSGQYTGALREFEEALLMAPWWADAYFNYALAQEAAKDYEGAIESCELFLLSAPNDPAARKIRNKIYALEVKAEQFAQFKPWLGKWRSGTGSVLSMQLKGDVLNMVEVEPSSTAYKNGWRPGDTVFYGRINGKKLLGKSIRIPTNANEIRCFGKRYEADLTAELTPDGMAMIMRERRARFNINACTIISYIDGTPYQYIRIAEVRPKFKPATLASIDTGKRAWLGVQVQTVTPKLALSLGSKQKEGALVMGLFEESPALYAGIEKGDVIIRFDNKTISTAQDLTSEVSAHNPGEVVDAVVLRNGLQKIIPVTLGGLDPVQ